MAAATHPAPTADGPAVDSVRSRGPAAFGAVTPRRAVASGADVVRVFHEDPELLAGLDPAATDLLRRRVVVPKLCVDAGPWSAPMEEASPGSLGLLVLDGLMIRSLSLAGRKCPELIGAGDVLRPWDGEEEDGSVTMSVSWTVLERTTFAVLDERFAPVLCRFPTIVPALLSRTVQRSQTLAFLLGIAHIRHAETRLHTLLWHLADRWGRVTPAGVHLPLALTHETLAQLVCMRRPTASTTLQRLARAGEVERRRDGTWLLTGQPPSFHDAQAA